jgi:hypothetical protein
MKINEISHTLKKVISYVANLEISDALFLLFFITMGIFSLMVIGGFADSFEKAELIRRMSFFSLICSYIVLESWRKEPFKFIKRWWGLIVFTIIFMLVFIWLIFLLV